jgi:hypothetical protein
MKTFGILLAPILTSCGGTGSESTDDTETSDLVATNVLERNHSIDCRLGRSSTEPRPPCRLAVDQAKLGKIKGSEPRARRLGPRALGSVGICAFFGFHTESDSLENLNRSFRLQGQNAPHRRSHTVRVF